VIVAPIIKKINISPLAKINEIIRKIIRREILINVIICCILNHSYEYKYSTNIEMCQKLIVASIYILVKL